MGRTGRQRKREKRRQRDLEREIERRIAADEPVLILKGSDTKVRPGVATLGEPLDENSDYAKRLAKARAFLFARQRRGKAD